MQTDAGHKRDYTLFLIAILLGGFGASFVDATFNNFLFETFKITDAQRAFLELPRELPGFLVAFVSALLFFMCNRTMAAFARATTAIGILLVGFCSVNYHVMLVWLFIYSSGQHLFMPVNADISMDFAKEGGHGKMLGKLAGAENLAGIAGALVVFLGFKYLSFSFAVAFSVAAVCFLASAVLIYMMKKNKPVPVKQRFVFRKRYGLYYWLTVLYGTRKQIFLTFAPWVLVSVFLQKVQVIAVLLLIAGVIGIGFKPLLGYLIDRLGEKLIIVSEGFLLIAICIGYGYSKEWFLEGTALYVTFACFVADGLLMSVNMARATYMKKIALNREELTSTLTMGTTIDHVFSISVALIGGIIWSTIGYRYIFLLGAGIAAMSAISAMFLKIPEKETA
ncbi:MAG: hypothetical protein A2044_07640 [Candidatus Firestonebacteria bacterium GWA2_43_8]|nr:MAG: hypothetical protein A2044_07640 [Candidatus Firestonebacteria bacterium GWA2_43_8]